MYSQGAGNIIVLGATATLSVATHAGHILLVPATCAITLPTIVATADSSASGPGADPNSSNNLGVLFTLVFTAASAGATAQTITCGGSDAFVGQIIVAGSTTAAFNSTASTIITLNSTTSGGAAAGSRLELTSFAAAKWSVKGTFVGSGTVITPYS
jgi:hypothetical protein